MVGNDTQHCFMAQRDEFMCPGHENPFIMMIFEISQTIMILVQIVLRIVLKILGFEPEIWKIMEFVSHFQSIMQRLCATFPPFIF